MERKIGGRHVFAMFAGAFGVVIAANLTLAWGAVRTFPGLEVRNSYVASQHFDAERRAQQALDWDVSAWLDGDELWLKVTQDGAAVLPSIEEAVFGRATSVVADQRPEFRQVGTALVADVQVVPGNWNLRLKARSANGTAFRQRIVVAARP